MDILTGTIEEKIERDILGSAVRHEYAAATGQIAAVLAELYANIPADKRISYGRVHTVKVLADHLYTHLAAAGAPVLNIAAGLYEASRDPLSRSVASASCPSAGWTITSRAAFFAAAAAPAIGRRAR